MEMENVIKHKVKSNYYNFFIWGVEGEEKLQRTINAYENSLKLLERLKSIVNDQNISDSDYFFKNYFEIYDLYITDLRGFAELILGKDINQIMVQESETEEVLDEVTYDERVTSHKNTIISYNAFSTHFDEDVKLKRETIIKFQEERKLLLIGQPIKEFTSKSADINYDYNSDREIYSLANYNENPGLFKPHKFHALDLKYFCENYKELLSDMRHSLSNQDIDKSKEDLKNIDFGYVLESYKHSREKHFVEALKIFKLEEKTKSYIESEKTLVKKPKN